MTKKRAGAELAKEVRGGQRLKAWRTEKGLRQHVIAAKLNVSAAVVSELEADKRLPTLERAHEIEILSEGGVPIESWAWDEQLIAAACLLCTRTKRAAKAGSA